MTPVKYECDTNNLTGTSARSKILLTEKLANGALVTPTPELLPFATLINYQIQEVVKQYSQIMIQIIYINIDTKYNDSKYNEQASA